MANQRVRGYRKDNVYLTAFLWYGASRIASQRLEKDRLVWWSIRLDDSISFQQWFHFGANRWPHTRGTSTVLYRTVRHVVP